ncbi:unnamed protein product [Zymoseptoria tritici ST99CH_3D7]|uniref:PNPLA domain-containing protein n=1 Tax=Zymoseptoria tritici (strain ST99CH_3D7) TaxID=1276538 RepID=A0A1X7RV46_ZYMT9|nr:unnamed protein product [Zymoseptoria tritici ST99CH_3D7]
MSSGAHVTGSGEVCGDCEQAQADTWFCNVCRMVICAHCWDRQAVHRKKPRPGDLPHEKTNHNVAKTIKDVLTPDLTDAAREKLHNDDFDTTWFGIIRDGSELPLIADYGRYSSLIARIKELRTDPDAITSPTTSTADALYPSLVSFVGQTGAGKSTLIKLLIDLNIEPDDPKFTTPVVGAHGRDVPTSEDVHLYLDPDSCMSRSQTPLLFADCEGLDGGARDPVGAKARRQMRDQAKGDASAAGARRRRRMKPMSERQLLWADSDSKKTREYAVANLYPRLLYTFSDVIVFVLKNPRTIEGVVERLVDWAQKALEESSNQPVLPHVIIALNAAENDIPEEQWDVDRATISLMASVAGAVENNQTLKRHAKFWKDRDRQVGSVEQLVLSYYSSVRVVRIPTDGIPNLIQGQVKKLSAEISKSCQAAREKKAELRMLLNADELEPYLQVAFDHFAKNLDEPFDFVQAAFTNSPIPNDFGGNILKLAIQVMNSWAELQRGPFIFEELSFVIASCIMLNLARNRYLGRPDETYPEYSDHVDNALENFCDRHWRCEFSSAKGERCVNVRSGHGAKGHQLKSGKLLAAGDYESKFNFHDYREKFQRDVYDKLVALHAKVLERKQEERSEDKAAAEIHKELILLPFFEHAFRGDQEANISHSVCYVCLFESPEHALPCGHIICGPCLRTYGKVYLNRYVEISECPMEPRHNRWRSPWQVYLKPASAGVRVLTLDGGGVRGVVELEILKHIERELGGRINVQSFFDLVVGTSTGGIIALGLTARNMTVAQCAHSFESLCKQAFTARKGINVPGISKLVEHYNQSKYETHPFEEALKLAFNDKQYLFGGQREESDRIDINVAVTTTSAAGSSVVLSNYNRLCLEKLPYQFQRPEKPSSELRTWEAARATSAAPTYFKPFCHEPSKRTYADGGLYHNNPVEVADQERKLLWPALKDAEPDIIVSLGTAYCPKYKDGDSTKWRPLRPGFLAQGRYLSKLAHDHVKMSLDSERTWENYLRIKQPTAENRKRYIRINPKLPDNLPKLDEVDKIDILKEATRLYLDSNPMIKTLAQRLVATCFYFDSGPAHEVSNADTFEVSGWLHCRFIAGVEVAQLAHFIRRNAVAGHDPHFLIKEENDDTLQPQEVRIDARILDRMVNEEQFRIDTPVHIRRSNKATATEISLCLTRGTSYPISGFPRKLHGERVTSMGNRTFLASSNSFRWASRSLRAKLGWKPPRATYAPLEKQDIIERYSEFNHLLGDPADAVSVHPGVYDTPNNYGEYVPYRPSIVHEMAAAIPDAIYILTRDHQALQHNGGYLDLRCGEKVKIIDKADPESWRGHRKADSYGWAWIPPHKLVPEFAEAQTGLFHELAG